MKTGWIHYKTYEILYVDYAGGKTEEELLANLFAAKPLLQGRQSQKIRILLDVTGSFSTPKFMSEAKKLEREFMYQFDTRRAVIGINGIKRLVLDGFNIFVHEKHRIKPFSTKDEALEYLVRQTF